MIIHRYVLSSISTILSYPANLTFDYVQSEIQLPYNIPFLNFIDLIHNVFYVVLNVTSTQLRQMVFKRSVAYFIEWKNVPIKISAIIVLCTDTILIAVTIYYRIRLANLEMLALKLL
jgi:hypothetical protein